MVDVRATIATISIITPSSFVTLKTTIKHKIFRSASFGSRGIK